MKKKTGTSWAIEIKIWPILLIIILISIALAFVKPVQKNSEPIIAYEEKTIMQAILPETLVTVEENTSTVTVKYVDTEENKIAEDKTITKAVGEEYYTERLKIAGYKSYGEEPINKKGIITEEEIEVVYTYQDAMNFVNLASEDNNVTVEILNEREAKEYEFIMILTGEEEEKISGGKFKLIDSEGGVLVDNITSYEGQVLIGVITANNEEENTYYIEQTGEIEGYKTIEGKIQVQIQKTWDSENNKYTINIIETENGDSINVVVEEDQIIVYVQYEKEEIQEPEEPEEPDTPTEPEEPEEPEEPDTPTEPEEPEEPDTPTEPEEPEEPDTPTEPEEPEEPDTPTEPEEPDEPEEIKENDLSIVEFISKCGTEKITDRIPQIVTKDEEAEYVINEETQKVANEQEIEITIRVYNWYGKAETIPYIYNYMPEGLEFIEDNEINKQYGWKMYNKDGIEVTNKEEMACVATGYLKGESLESYFSETEEKYKEIKIVLKVNEDNVNEERTLTNITILGESEQDKNKDNNQATESMYVKYFDLNITKYLSKLEVIEDGEVTKTITRTIENKGELVKQEVSDKKLSNTQMQLTYKIVVKNEGEIAGYVLEIADYIPEGLALDTEKSENWILQNDTAKTNVLAGNILEPGESIEVEIVLNWETDTLDAVTQGNQAEILKYYNEYNAEDITDNNIDEEKVLISIKTGGDIVQIIGVILIAIGILLVPVIKIKNTLKNNKK